LHFVPGTAEDDNIKRIEIHPYRKLGSPDKKNKKDKKRKAHELSHSK
jgi:hypothetical protein